MIKSHKILQTENVNQLVAIAHMIVHWAGDLNFTNFSSIQKDVRCCAIGKGFYTNLFFWLAMLVIEMHCVGGLCRCRISD